MTQGYSSRIQDKKGGKDVEHTELEEEKSQVCSSQIQDRVRVEFHDVDTNYYIYNCTQLVGNQLMDQFDGDYGIEQNTTLKLVNVKSCLPLDIMPSPREIKGMAKELFSYDSVIYAALLKRINVLVYRRNGRSCSPSVVGVFSSFLEVCHTLRLLCGLTGLELLA